MKIYKIIILSLLCAASTLNAMEHPEETECERLLRVFDLGTRATVSDLNRSFSALNMLYAADAQAQRNLQNDFEKLRTILAQSNQFSFQNEEAAIAFSRENPDCMSEMPGIQMETQAMFITCSNDHQNRSKIELEKTQENIKEKKFCLFARLPNGDLLQVTRKIGKKRKQTSRKTRRFSDPNVAIAVAQFLNNQNNTTNNGNVGNAESSQGSHN